MGRSQVGRVNDNTVAAIGARASSAILAYAGAAIGQAATRGGLTATYADGANAINAFFADVRSGVARSRVIWIAGNRATNNTLDTAELAASGPISYRTFIEAVGLRHPEQAIDARQVARAKAAERRAGLLPDPEL